LFPGYLNDHLTGYLAAFSACAALIHEPSMVAVIGCVCLRTAVWVQDLGRANLPFAEEGKIVNSINPQERESFMMESNSPFGMIKHVAPVVKYSKLRHIMNIL
jgi:hypothetical protein